MKRNLFVLSILFLLMFFFVQSGYSFDQYPNLAEYAQVKSMLESGTVLLINSLSQIEYDAETIPGSICLPMEEVESSSLMPEDKGKALIFFCKGPKCHKSHVSAFMAEKMGYKNVFVYSGGIPDWAMNGGTLEHKVSYKGVTTDSISTDGLKADLDSGKEIFILDIQDEKTFAKHHLEKAVNIPFYQLHERTGEVPQDADIILIDKAAKQTPLAGKYLKKNGYQKVKFLDGGVLGWLKAGLSAVTK
ncbi:MAG: rhodanese-like domain-containing protein [Candidatus Aureabacteria bacterium]|nr:rhodanese-like domain-containing protein [Candidatus Auribacterota bacterium]